MSNSIAIRTRAHAPAIDPDDLRALHAATLADLAALRASILLITAKLDADGGVTDTNYAATTNPAALTLLA